MTADEPVAGVPRLCARRADCTRPRGHDDECGPDRADTELADLRAEVERLRSAEIDWMGRYGQLTDFAREIEAERDTALAHLAEAEGVARTNAAWVQQQHAAAKEAREQVNSVRALADEWRQQPGPAGTDSEPYAVGHLAGRRAAYANASARIVAALDAVEPADQRVWLCSQCGEMPSAMVKIGTSDGWCVTCLDVAAEPAGQPHPTPEPVQAARDASDAALAAATDGKAPSLLPRSVRADQPHPTPEADER